jgi:MATE family multidrug resistance protein
MNKNILKLAIPNIISNLTVPLLSSVDTALMGHLENIYYLGAIAVGGMIFNFVYWGFAFLRMGTTGLTAQAFGKKNDRESIFVLSRALVVALVISLILIVCREYIVNLSFSLVDATSNVEHYGRIYFSIRIMAAPATLSLYVFTGWFLGMQNAKYPLYLALITNALHIVFHLIFIKIYGMDVDGVALGTVCANYLGLISALLLFFKSYFKLTSYISFKFFLDWTSFRNFFRVGRDIFIRTLILIFAFSFFTVKSAEAGDLILAANSILINLWAVMSYGIDGFAFAAESLIGKFIGAQDERRLKTAVRNIFGWGIGLGIFFSLAFLLFSEQILAIFTNNADVKAQARQLIIWTQLAPLLGSFCYIWDGIFIGATATKAMRNTMIICILVFYLPVYYLGKEVLGAHALWLALSFFILARGITLTFYYKREVVSKIYS